MFITNNNAGVLRGVREMTAENEGLSLLEQKGGDKLPWRFTGSWRGMPRKVPHEGQHLSCGLKNSKISRKGRTEGGEGTLRIQQLI